MAVERLHRITRFIEDAYGNVGSDLKESGELDLLRRLRPLSFRTAVDVGANVGEWSIHALESWPAATVHAFEVAPRTFATLSANLARTDEGSRARLNNCGLGEHTGVLQMFYFPDHPELTCDLPRHGGYASIPFDAQILSGDDYLERQGISGIDFLKIDVEGAEHLVLKGFAKTLAEGRVRCVQFEYGAFSIATRILLADYYDMLAARYWIGKIFPTHVEFRDYVWTDEDFSFANFLCVLRDEPDVKRHAENGA